MSPEQARGKATDRRSDIWAFGCVLFEMLTGRKTFETGETVSDAVAAILTRDPDWTRCLPPPPVDPPTASTMPREDPDRRLHHIADARLEISRRDECTRSDSEERSRGTRSDPLWMRLLPWAVAATAIGRRRICRLEPTRAAGFRFRSRQAIGAHASDGCRVVHIQSDGCRLAGRQPGRVRRCPGRNSTGVSTCPRPVRGDRSERFRQRHRVLLRT